MEISNEITEKLKVLKLRVRFKKSERLIILESALDGNLETNLADGIANQIYPGYYDFNKKLEQVKLLLSNLDGQKNAIAKDIEEVASGKSESSSQLRRYVYSHL